MEFYLAEKALGVSLLLPVETEACIMTTATMMAMPTLSTQSLLVKKKKKEVV